MAGHCGPRDGGGRETAGLPRPNHSPHLQEDLPELRAHLHQGVQVPAVGGHTHRLEVVGLELLLTPASTEATNMRHHQPTKTQLEGKHWTAFKNKRLPLIYLGHQTITEPQTDTEDGVLTW